MIAMIVWIVEMVLYSGQVVFSGFFSVDSEVLVNHIPVDFEGVYDIVEAGIDDDNDDEAGVDVDDSEAGDDNDAEAGDDVMELPIRSILQQQVAPLSIYWAK